MQINCSTTRSSHAHPSRKPLFMYSYRNAPSDSEYTQDGSAFSPDDPGSTSDNRTPADRHPHGFTPSPHASLQQPTLRPTFAQLPNQPQAVGATSPVESVDPTPGIPTLKFEANVSLEHQEMFKELQEAAPWFPQKSAVRISTPRVPKKGGDSRDKLILHGQTEFFLLDDSDEDEEALITMYIDPDDDAALSEGRMSYEFLHEYLGHGLAHFDVTETEMYGFSERTEHFRLFYPSNAENNRWHLFIKERGLPLVKPHRRPYFLQAYALDMYVLPQKDCHGTPDRPGSSLPRNNKEILERGTQWGVELYSKVPNPSNKNWRLENDEYWKSDKEAYRRKFGDRNPLAITQADRDEDDQYLTQIVARDDALAAQRRLESQTEATGQ